MITFYAAVVYISPEMTDNAKNAVTILIFVMNIWFFSLWIYIALRNTKYSLIVKIRKLIGFLSLVHIFLNDQNSESKDIMI